MTHKTGRITAYGMSVVIMVSAMSIHVQAEKLSGLMPSAGIGVTFSSGVTLAKIQEKVLAEAAQDENMKLSVSEMKTYLEGRKAAPKTIVSASIVKAVEVQQVLAQIEEEQAAKEAEALAKQEAAEATASEKPEETVIATVADAGSNEAMASGNTTATEEQTPATSGRDNTLAADAQAGSSENTQTADGENISSVKSNSQTATSADETMAEAASDRTENTVSGNNAETKPAISDSVKAIGEKVIETTQSTAELAAAEAASMTDEEKEFSNLVIAQVNNYVNVRSDADENSEVVGKLYDKSVGTYLSEKDGWYEINSGNVTGYVKGEYCVTGKDAVELAKQVGTRIATVTTTTLKVRDDASTEAAVLGLVPIDEELSVVEEQDGWVKVDIEEGHGWVSMDYVTLRTDFVKAESKAEEEARLAKEAEERRKAQAAAAANSKKPVSGNKNYNAASSFIPAGGGSASGNAVAQFALQFQGNPYVYGGTSLTNGADCSGFVMSVYKNFGVSLPHSSSADRRVGSAVGSLAEAQPGDIICYSGHVALYIGGNQIVHASTSKTGIIVSRANYRNILAIRRIF